MFGSPRGPEGPRGPDTGRSEFKNIDVLPLGKTLGIKQSRGPKLGLNTPRPMNIKKLLMRGFPSASKKQLEA